MKKYLVAAAIAILALAGPTVGAANAQTWFNRGGPTLVDRLVGNAGYSNYGYGANPYANYNYFGNRYGNGMCRRVGFGGLGNMGYGGYGNMGYGGYGNTGYGGYGNTGYGGYRGW
jgi:hypothetical protein